MLKHLDLPGYGKIVCGRKKSELFTVPSMPSAPHTEQVYSGVNSIREAAKSGHPIYPALSNMLGNNKFGDCACVAALKMQAIFDCAPGREFRAPTLEDALWLYSQVTHPPFDPSTGANDSGSRLQDVLSFWQSHGLYKDGHGKIKAAYSVDGSNKEEVLDALSRYRMLYAGCDLPSAWDEISGTGFTWGMAGPPDPNAGHSTFLYGANLTGPFDGTWGMEGTVPWDAFKYYFGSQDAELYAVVPA